MRILHLIDASGPQATSTTLMLLADSLTRLKQADQHVMLLGGGALSQAAAAVGIHNATKVSVPFGQAVLGWAAVRRHSQRMGRFDLIHCWSVGAFSRTSLMWRSTPRVLTLTVSPCPRTVKWLRLLSSESSACTVMLPISSTIRRTLLGGGLAESSTHVLRPAIDLSQVDPTQRHKLRTQWGVRSETVKTVALLSDPPWGGDAMFAGMASMIADDSESTRGLKIRLLVHPDQINRLRLQTTVHHLERTWSMIQEPRLAQPWSVLPGCDVVLSLGPHGGGMSLLWAMAANVPIIGHATYAISEIVEDRHSALLAGPDLPKKTALRITQLLKDTNLSWKLRDTARHEAYSFFSPQRYRQSLQTVYEQILNGQEVQIPAMEATGGLRFAGQA